MGNTKKPLRPNNLYTKLNLAITLFFILLFTISLFLHLHAPSPYYIHTNLSSNHNIPRSIDLRYVEFAWNKLWFDSQTPPPTTLRIAVFSRKWPTGTVPGGMERHAHTLHTALSRRGHQVHVFTSPNTTLQVSTHNPQSPIVHRHEGAEPNKWQYKKAWDQFQEENHRAPFDVIHSESVALPYWMAGGVPNLVVSWHGIELERMQSLIYQDLTRKPNETILPAFNDSLQGMIPKVLKEIRFFPNYAHHVATSDSCGEMLRDVYQIRSERVHVIVNGVDEDDFSPDLKLGKEFRSEIGLPNNASLVLGVAGRLVEDKGHRLLYEAFSELKLKHTNVYLIVVGSGPWLRRYKELGSQVIVLGSMSPLELRSFYNVLDIFVNPTLRPQGLDLTLMEAMMSGKPVMASRFPSIKGTVLVDDEFGFMFSPNVESLHEALETVVMEGSERLARRGKACKEYAGTMFTAQKMALAYERLFLCVKNQTYCMYHST